MSRKQNKVNASITSIIIYLYVKRKQTFPSPGKMFNLLNIQDKCSEYDRVLLGNSLAATQRAIFQGRILTIPVVFAGTVKFIVT